MNILSKSACWLNSIPDGATPALKIILATSAEAIFAEEVWMAASLSFAGVLSRTGREARELQRCPVHRIELRKHPQA